LCGFSIPPSANALAPQLVNTHEINTDCRDITLGICIICESQQKTRLSYTGITDKEKFEEIIVSVEIVSPVHFRGGISSLAETIDSNRTASLQERKFALP
jgi:hypothetical protein